MAEIKEEVKEKIGFVTFFHVIVDMAKEENIDKTDEEIDEECPVTADQCWDKVWDKITSRFSEDEVKMYLEFGQVVQESTVEVLKEELDLSPESGNED